MDQGEEGQDSDIQTMRSEGGIVEEFGSWHDYMQVQRPLSYFLMWWVKTQIVPPVNIPIPTKIDSAPTPKWCHWC